MRISMLKEGPRGELGGLAYTDTAWPWLVLRFFVAGGAILEEWEVCASYEPLRGTVCCHLFVPGKRESGRGADGRLNLCRADECEVVLGRGVVL